MSNKRAEEVAKMIGRKIIEECVIESDSLIARELSSLPDFQEGRELTVEDIREISRIHSLYYLNLDWYSYLAAELNKIRAPKADIALERERALTAQDRDAWKDSHQALQQICNEKAQLIDVLAKEHDELKIRLENANSDRDEIEFFERQAAGWKSECEKIAKERDELKAQQKAMQELAESEIAILKSQRDGYEKQLREKSAPVGVTKEQVKAAWDSLSEFPGNRDQVAEALAAALSPKWIDPKNLPIQGQAIYFEHKDGGIIVGYFEGIENQWRGVDINLDDFNVPTKDVLRWMPRFVPSPPQAEESEQIKRIKEVFADDSREWEHDRGGLSLKRVREVVIEIVKQFEKEKAK